LKPKSRKAVPFLILGKSRISVGLCEQNHIFQTIIIHNKRGKLTSESQVSIPLQVVSVGAFYAQSFPIFRKLKTNFRKRNISVFVLF